MARVDMSLLVTFLALMMLFSYEMEVCDGRRGFKTNEVTTIGRSATGLVDEGFVTHQSDKYRYLTQNEHVAIHSPVAYYGAEEVNDTTPGHSPGAGHSTGPGAATPVISN